MLEDLFNLKESQNSENKSGRRFFKLYSLNNRPWYKFYTNQRELYFPEVSLYFILEKAAEEYGNRAAIIYEHTIITYLELKDKVDRLALSWKEMGIEKGERIGLMLGNHPDYIISYYAAQALGLIVVQINPMYTPRELMGIVSDCKVSYLVTEPSTLKNVNKVCELYRFQSIFLSQWEKDDRNSPYISLETLKDHPRSLKEPSTISVSNDIAVIQYTGGTSGKMKGVMLTHHNLISNVIQSYWMYGEMMNPGQEVFLSATPLYHVYGMTSAMNLGIYIGATILLFKKFEIDHVLESIKKYRPTFFPGVPKMYNAFVNHPQVENYELDCLKLCSCGSAPLPVEVIKRFEQLTGAVIGEGFGLSEASPTTHRNPRNLRKVGSIGIPLPGTDSMIVDESGQELPPMSVGELIIKGPQVMKGYWNNELETCKALQNEWLYTGDLATMDKDGYFYIVGRKKEMVIVGGFNVYPQEVESVLYEHPSVLEAAVVGIPDPVKGEIVKAYIVPKAGAQIDLDDLRDYCYEKLTRYKVPKFFEIRNSLPRNSVGKLLKRELVKEEQEKGEKINAN
jgi:long-chain acyl-CoA synthetase